MEISPIFASIFSYLKKMHIESYQIWIPKHLFELRTLSIIELYRKCE